MIKSILCSCFVAVAASAATWTGGGDGASWGDPNNWGGSIPGASEAVSITTGASALTINLGATDRECGAITVDGSAKLTFSGTASLKFTSITTKALLDVAVPVTLKSGSNSITCWKNTNFTKPISKTDNGNVTFATGGTNNRNNTLINVNDTFTASAGSITVGVGFAGSTTAQAVHFYGVVTAKNLYCGRNYVSGQCFLHASGNSFEYVDVAFSGLGICAVNAFPESLCLTWNGYYCERSTTYGFYDFRGNDQTVNCITNTWLKDDPERQNCTFLRSTIDEMTLTLKGTRNAVANCRVDENINIVWDPVGDYTQEFTTKVNPANRNFTVKRGTLKVSGTATFAVLAGIEIKENATFELASTVSDALAGLTQLRIASGGTMKVASTSLTAMSGCSCTAHIAAGGTIEADAALTLSGVEYNGTQVQAGVYGAGATPVPWATGSAAITVLGSGEVTSETRYWTGLGDGVSWNDDANWDAKAPASLDSAYFTNSATITSAVNIDGTRLLNVANGCTVTLTGTVSGPANITKDGPGYLVLTGSNTFTGTLFINKGRVTARGENALGDNASGAIDVSKLSDTLVDNLILGGVTVKKNLIIRNRDDASNSYARQLSCEANTVNTVLGALDVPNSYLRMYAGANAKFIIAGGGSFNTAQFFDMGAGGEVIVTNSPIPKKIYDDANTAGWLTLSVPGNTYSQYNSDHNRGMRNHVRTTVNGAFSSSSYFYFGGSGLLDLCGTTQSLSRIEALTKSSSDWTPAASGTIKSDLPAFLTFNWGNTYTNSAIYTGCVSLEQAGAGTLYLTAASTSTGDLIASAGRIVLKDGAKWRGGIVVNGGTLDVPGPDALAADAALSLKDGTLNLAAGEYCFASATDANGDPIAPGRYSSAASGDVNVLEGLAGPGVLTVLPPVGTDATYVWTGAGNGRFSTAANWEGGALPDFQNPGGRYVFPGNGFTATVDVNMFAKSFEFPSGLADSVKLVASDGADVTFVDGSIVVTSQTAVAKKVVFDVPVKFSTSLRARVGNPDALDTRSLSLIFSNRISTVGLASFTKDGCGTVRVVGDNNLINGDVTATNGYFYVSGADPLGGSGTMIYRQTAAMQAYSKFIVDGAIVTRDVICYQGGDYQTLLSAENSTNLFLGKVSNNSGHFRMVPANGSVITFAGGVAPGNFLIMQTDGTGYCVISNTPIVTTGSYWVDAETSAKNVFACAGNSFTGGQHWHVSNTLELRVDNAILSNNILNFCYWGNTTPRYGKLDLLDTKQELAQISRNITTNANGTVKYLSAGCVDGLAGSRLKVSGSQTTQILPTFTGAASFENAGTAVRHLRNACTSTGELHVVSGTLVMDAPGAAYYGVAQPTASFEGGSWAGPKVTLSGGELQVNHAKAFDRHASIYVPYGSAGTINLAAGVVQKMEYLYLEDENGVWQRQRTGRWGAAGSGTSLTAECFTGSGKVDFLGLFAGTVIIFK